MWTKSKITLAGLSVILLWAMGVLAYKYPSVEPFKTAWRLAGKAPAGNHDTGQKKEKYYCPMHPSYVSDKPDNCPVCQMKLVPIDPTQPSDSPMKDLGMPTQAAPPAGTEPAPQGFAPVNISPQRQQLIGVTTEEVRIQPLKKTIRTVGKVEIDERRIAEIHPKISGWAEKVYVNTTWQHVHQGEPLLEIYSPELVQTQEEYLLALRTRETLGKSPFPEISAGGDSLLEAARRRLLLWDITPEQIQALEKRGQSKKTMTIYSPITGHVTQRDVSPSKRVEPAMKLYTIVDHSVVWVQVDIYENEIPFVKVGQNFKMTVNSYPGEAFHGTVTFIWPHVERMTRALKARLEFQNPTLKLKPDMYATVEVEVPMGRKLSVPDGAILDSGTRRIVFVDNGNGYFEPREVKLGPEVENRYVVLSGLQAGERVVTSANFLIDSESRLRGAMAGMGMPSMPVMEGKKGKEKVAQPADHTAGLNIQFSTSPDPPKSGDNEFEVKVIDREGKPVTGAQVEVVLYMPPMGSMPAMRSQVKLTDQGGGVYKGKGNVMMAGPWQVSVAVRRDGQPIGSTQLQFSAR